MNNQLCGDFGIREDGRVATRGRDQREETKGGEKMKFMMLLTSTLGIILILYGWVELHNICETFLGSLICSIGLGGLLWELIRARKEKGQQNI